MKEFMMIFRHAPNPNVQLTAEQMQASIKQWKDWIGGIAAQGKFVSTGQLGTESKVLRQDNTITAGPYAEVKEIVGGYLTVKAASLDEAFTLTAGCPILQMGGHVEVRNILKMD